MYSNKEKIPTKVNLAKIAGVMPTTLRKNIKKMLDMLEESERKDD